MTTQQTTWTIYTGSDEQIAEIRNCKNGFIVEGKSAAGKEHIIFPDIIDSSCIDMYGVTHYLICNPHPLANMIIRQAQTGQPVWIRWITADTRKLFSYNTTTPDWNIPNAEYSFTPWED